MTNSPALLAKPPSLDFALTSTRRAHELTEPQLRAAVGQLEPWLARISGYHLGWCDADGRPTVQGPGKIIRPALALLSAEAVGAQAEAAVPAAVAVELLHNFSLIHDDIMDGDEQRRKRPAVWKVYGVAAAILAGDALQGLAIEILLDHGGPHALPATRRLAAAMRELSAGQSQDMQFTQRPWLGEQAVSVAEYRKMADAKTGSLLACATSVGAILGGGSPEAVAALDQAARHLGLGFQCADDVLGIWGDPAVTGKPVFNDLRERKKTLPVLAALGAGTSASQQLAEFLTRTAYTDTDLRFAATLIEEAGGKQLAEQETAQQFAAGRKCLDGLNMRPAVRAEFEALTQSLMRRVK